MNSKYFKNNDENEFKFLQELQIKLKDFYEMLFIKKINYCKSFIDFVILNENNGIVCYLELKSLKKPIDKDFHIINITKIQKILQYYKNSIVIFDYRSTGGELYYIEINDNFLYFDTDIILQQPVYKIPISKTKIGIENLLDDLILKLIIKN